MIYICKPKKVRVYINVYPYKTMQQIKAETGCDVICNGQLFNSDLTPSMNLRVDGKTLRYETNYLGYGWNANDTALTLTRSCEAYHNFISCIPLIENGKALSLKNGVDYPAALGGTRGRTAIGMLPDGRLALYCSRDNTSGARSMDGIQEEMMKLGCVSALNLDGGGSSSCITPEGTLNTTRTIHNYILIWSDDRIEGNDDKMKIYLSPSSQPANAYAAGNTNEQVQCNRIAEAAKKALERCGFQVKKAPEGQSYQANVTESNAWGADLHVPIHTNAGGGYGPIVFVYGTTAARLKYAQPVYNELCEIVPKANTYGVQKKTSLYEVANTKATCVYVECEFHDNAALARWIVDHAESIGEAICKGICKGAGVSYVAPAAKELSLEERVAALETWARANGMK